MMVSESGAGERGKVPASRTAAGLLDSDLIVTVMRQHGIRLKRDDGGIRKTAAAFVRRTDGGTHSRLLVESGILLTASRSNPAAALKDAAAAYKVNTDAIALKVKQEFAAKQKSKTAHRQRPSQRREPARHGSTVVGVCLKADPIFMRRLPAVAWLLLEH